MFCGSKKFPSHFSVVCPSVCVESALIYGRFGTSMIASQVPSDAMRLTLARRDWHFASIILA